jgi:membrane protein DedA with SNARE-associated domain
MDANWFTDIVNDMGYVGVALLMFLENIVPPIPSEVVMPAAGFASRQGDLNFLGVIVAGTLGSLAGTLPWYLVARWLGEERLGRFVEKHGKWLTLSKKEYDRSLRWFDRWGTWTVLFGRMVPTVRTLISVPAGLSKMSLTKFLIYSSIGTLCWNLALAGIGWYLGDNYQVVGDYIGWISIGIIAAIVIWLIVRFWSRHHSSKASGLPTS